jgi:acetyl esterase/lipase
VLTRRDLMSAAGVLAAGVLTRSSGFAQSASAGVASPDPMSYVNPEFRAALGPVAKMMEAVQSLDASSLASLRQGMNMPGTGLAPSPPVTEKTIPGPAAAPGVRVYVVGNSPGSSKPAVLHMHGGGYVMGSAASSRRDIQNLSTALDCVAVSVEYRLAPETTFPGSLEDNYAALRWMYMNAKELGIDVKRIAIKGESAGGGHAATLAIAARDRGEFAICFQVLIYPMLDDRTGSTREVPAHLGHYLWTPASNRFGWTSLLGVPAGSAAVPPNSVPARVSNLKGLPPAFIGVGSIDLFVPEDIEYAQRLVAAGVAVELNVVPGAFHAFDGIAADASLSRQFAQAWREALHRAFTQTA